ncbi:MAG TPA: glycosyl hydrolase family 8 [Coleofasciculaceae cyanobacterium]|jgi:endoglucanase
MLVLVLVLRLANFFKGSQWCLRAVTAIAVLISLAGCISKSSTDQPKTPESSSAGQPEASASPSRKATVSSSTSSPSLPESTANRELLEQSWVIYRQQFIQEDGRVIDYQDSDRSVSEGQAYAMLRAVLINDPTTFNLTLKWAENNLRRRSPTGAFTDQLWAWKWGKNKDGKWGAIDKNFASDADIDAITALILASRRWNRPEYLDIARTKLQDLWKFSTIAVPGGKRYLLPGPTEAFVPSPTTLYLNPSYLAPYAFRLFAQVDSAHDWLSLVDSSYQVLEKSSQVSTVGLPSDWIALDTKTGKFQPLPPSSKLQSVYSFDAYRVWWRVAWDAAWFQSSEAERYLRTATKHLQTLLGTSSRLPAAINLQGKPTVNYEATSQYAMLYTALSSINPATAQQLLDKKLLPRYKQGIWDDESAYYTQNLAWIGLLPPTVIDPQLLRTQ